VATRIVCVGGVQRKQSIQKDQIRCQDMYIAIDAIKSFFAELIINPSTNEVMTTKMLAISLTTLRYHHGDSVLAIFHEKTGRQAKPQAGKQKQRAPKALPSSYSQPLQRIRATVCSLPSTKGTQRLIIERDAALLYSQIGDPWSRGGGFAGLGEGIARLASTIDLRPHSATKLAG
jgi:hypothetical protein